MSDAATLENNNNATGIHVHQRVESMWRDDRGAPGGFNDRGPSATWRSR